MNTYIGADLAGNVRVRCKECNHVLKWHIDRTYNKANGYCRAFGCKCRMKRMQLK